MKHKFRLSVMAFAIFSMGSTAAMALTTESIYDASGTPFALARFFDTTDGPYDNGEGEASTWNLSQLQRENLLSALHNWAEIITVVPGQAPATFNIGTMDVVNASANSELAPYSGGLWHQFDPRQTWVQVVIQNAQVNGLRNEADGVIKIGRIGFANQPYAPSQLIIGKKADISVVMFHEIGHALGILNIVENLNPGSEFHNVAFANEISEYSSHLRDDNGNAARPGQIIWCDGCVNPPVDKREDAFDVRRDKGYFAGAHVSEVLSGAMPGVPVRMTPLPEDGKGVDANYMSHLELKNSLMSHQSFRNYTHFMEAELAVMQDLGYQIDRRNFYGSSIYGSGLTLVNDNPYFKRNADHTGYLANTYNTATLGVGLHVYGSFNNVSQRADLLSAGAGGAGIRVDGQGNLLTIQPGTRVHANGALGRAVMFAYGKGHEFVQRGDVQALGKDGIAVSFDFGGNPLGPDMGEYRGSYIRVNEDRTLPILDEINGPLVDRFDLTGRVAGKSAAIFISDNAYVKQINIMRGASLYGDITSLYSQQSLVPGYTTLTAPRLTNLTFGMMPDAQGRSTNVLDPTFALRYDGNITGRDNLVLQMKAGVTSLNGGHDVYAVEVSPGATLTGNSRYKVQEGLMNDGTIAPLSHMMLDGDYAQSKAGRLRVALGSNGEVKNSLAVNGDAYLGGGTLEIVPQRGWYANGYRVASDKWLTVTGARDGDFDKVEALLTSPTLTALGAKTASRNTYSVTFSRVANAYARHGADDNGRSVGAALDGIAGNAALQVQPLLAALDFSAADGGEVRTALKQLAPTAYDAMLTGGLLRERQITDMVAGAVTPAIGSTQEQEDWRVFATPFGSQYQRNGHGDSVASRGSTYGMVFGAEKAVGDARAWTIGVHGAVSGQSTRLKGEGSGSGRTTAADIGIHARYAADPLAGAHAFALVRIGMEDVRVDRTVAVNGYMANPRGSWTGMTAAATIGGGWRWKLGNASSIGPVAALDYTALHRPGVTETRGNGAGLRLDDKTFNGLRTRLGGEVRVGLPTAAGNSLTAHLRSTWNHELTGAAVTQTAAFASQPGANFSTSSDVASRDSLGLEAGLSYRLGQRVTLGTVVSSNFYRGVGSDVAGSVSATWRF